MGGDWYDVVESKPGRVAAVIGDVVGHGVHAAAVMGRLRTGLRAFILDGRSPGDAVERLDELMRGFEHRQMATLFHLEIDLASGRAKYVRAGHPPALVRTPNGNVVELRGRGSAPLGVLEDVGFEQVTAEVPPGSTVLLYTDGLIERRNLDLNVGIESLKVVLADATGSADEVLDRVTGELETERVPDDIALLALKVAPRQTPPSTQQAE